MRELDWLVLKSGLMIIWFVVAYLFTFYFWRKKVRNLIIATIFPIIPAFLLVLPFYGMRFYKWVNESQKVVEIVVEKPLYLSLGIVLSAVAILIGNLLSRKVRLGLWGWTGEEISHYHFRAVGQFMSMGVLLYFLHFLQLNVSFIMVSCMFASFLASEFFKSFYSPDVAEPSRPASRLRRLAYRWTGTAGPEEKVYLPSLFCLLALLSLFVWLPDYLVPAVMVAMISDPAATFFGLKIGKHKWLGDKTIEGSIVFFVLSLACLSIFGYGTLLILTVSAIATLLEGVGRRGADNLLIPVGVSLSLRFLPF